MTIEKITGTLDKILEYSLYGLAFFIPISIAFVETFTIMAIAAFVLKNILRMRWGIRQEGWKDLFLTPANIFLLLFFVFCGFSLVHSGSYFSTARNALIGKWGKAMMLYVVAASSFGSKGRFEKWALIFLVSAALVGIDACFQKFLGLEFMFHHGMTAVHFAGRTEFAATGAFKHANALAAYLICALPLLAGMTVSLKTSYRFPLSIVVFLLTISLALTFSRGGWLGFIIALGLMIICLPQKRFFLALGGVFIFSIFLLSGGSERAAVSFQPGGDSGRYQLWGGAWAMIQNHPLVGQGVGTFMAFFKDYVHGRGMMYAHNCYLQIWAETGIFGLLSFLMFIGLVFRSGLIALRQSVDGKTGGILVGLLCGVVAFLIQSALDTNLYSLQLSAMFWLFLGMIQALSCPAREARRIHNGGSI